MAASPNLYGRKLAVNVIVRIRRCRIRHGSAYNLATSDAGQALFAHEALDRAARHGNAFAFELPPDLLCAIDLHIEMPNPFNLRQQDVIALGACAAQLGLPLMGSMAAIRRRGHLQDRAGGLYPEAFSVTIDECPYGFCRRSTYLPTAACTKKALASFKISLARRNSLFSRSNALIRSCSSPVTPALSPVSTSRHLSQLSSVCGLQPTLPATDSMVAQCEPYSLRCSCTSRTARSRNSGEILVVVVIVVFIVAPISQMKEPPQNPG